MSGRTTKVEIRAVFGHFTQALERNGCDASRLRLENRFGGGNPYTWSIVERSIGSSGVGYAFGGGFSGRYYTASGIIDAMRFAVAVLDRVDRERAAAATRENVKREDG